MRHLRTRMRWLVLLLLLFLGAPVHAQPSPEGTPSPVASPSPVATPVPLAEIATQMELAEQHRRDLEDQPLPPELQSVEDKVPELRRTLQSLRHDTQVLVSADPTLDSVRGAQARWTDFRNQLQATQSLLTRATATLDDGARSLSQMIDVWQATLESARLEAVPPELLTRLEAFPPKLKTTQSDLQVRRTDMLALQAQLSDFDAQARQGTASLNQLRAAAIDRIFLQDGAPLWSPSAYAEKRGLFGSLWNSFQAQWQAAGEYTATHIGHVLVHLALGGLVTLALFQVRARVAPWSAREPGLARPLAVFQAPVTMTLVLSLLFRDQLYPEAPRLVNALLAALALLPSGALLARLLSPNIRPVLVFLVTNFLVDQVRLIMDDPRLLQLGQTAVAALFFGGYMFFYRARLNYLMRLACWLGLAAFTLATCANVTGFVSLATVVGDTALIAGYVALFASALLNVTDALAMLAMLVPPLSLLAVVQKHRLLLRSRVRLVLKIFFGGLWLVDVLEELSLWEPTWTGFVWLLGQGVDLGELRVTLGDLVGFVVIMLLSVWLSHFVRFVLDEDVYPRVELPRGLPYALSTMLHYCILVIGFVIAMGALGLDTGKFTVVAGALGVGIGFGLQNIVNNFVSGIILLFERPVKVGDTVRIGTQTGELMRIGMRASVVRTWEGSEVIVPNGSLIQQEVTNWSSASRRRLEIRLGVAYGTPPEKVIEIFHQVASAHPDVLEDPAPEGIFLDFGDSALLFQLRATTQSDWQRVRSDLLIALNRALAQAGIDIPFPQIVMHRADTLLREAGGPPGPVLEDGQGLVP